MLQHLVIMDNMGLGVEHNLEMVKCADWVIDLGPERGQAGGYLVAQGTVEQVVQRAESVTGRWLKKLLSVQART